MSESMIEFRKEFFADERDDRLNEIGARRGVRTSSAM
jgi:hypothetical protein